MSGAQLALPEPIRHDPNHGFSHAFLHHVYDLAWVVAILCFGPVLW